MTLRTRRLSRQLLASALFLLTAVAGGVVAWTQWAALALLAAAGALYARHAARAEHAVPVPTVGLWGLAALALIVLQALPLPLGLVRLLSPAAAQAQQDLGALLGHTPGFVPLSLHAIAASDSLRHAALLLLALALGYALGGRPSGRRRVLTWVGWLGAGFTLVAAAHALVGDGLFLLVVKPRYPLYPGASTLVNPNHAVGLLVLTLPVSVGLTLDASLDRSRWLHGAASLGQAVLLALTPSGTAVVALPSLALLALVLGRTRAARDPSDAPRPAPWWLGVSAALALATLSLLFVSGALEGIVSQWQESLHSTKGAFYAEVLALIARVPWTGTGAGAFTHAFDALVAQRPFTFRSPESVLLGAPAAFGALAGLALLVGLGLPLLRALWRARADRSLGALAVGVAAFTQHELADFALELPATGALFALLAGLLLRGTTPREVALARAWRPRTFALASLLLLALPLAGQAALRAHTPFGCLSDADAPAPVDAQTDLDALAAAGARYPLDGATWARAGLERLRRGQPQGLDWLRYGARVSPTNRSIRVALARRTRVEHPAEHEAWVRDLALRFWESGRPDARNPPIHGWILREVLHTQGLRRAPRALLGDDLAKIKRYLAELRDATPLLRREALGALVHDYEDNLDVLHQLQGLLAAPDLAGIRGLWHAILLARHDHDPRTWQVLARHALVQGDRARAIRHLQRARHLGGPHAHLGDELLFRELLAAGRLDDARLLLVDLEAVQVLPAPTLLLLRARLDRAEGKPDAALAAVERVCLDTPGHVEALRLRATLLADLHRTAQAADAWFDVYRRSGDERDLERAESLRERARLDAFRR